MSDVTRILSQIKEGDPQAAEKLVPMVYEELRKLGGSQRQFGERVWTRSFAHAT